MKSTPTRTAVGLIVFCTLLLADALADPILSIQPPSTSVAAGSTFSVDVNISNVTDLSAFQFDVDFNPSVLSATSITEGSFLPGGGTTFFIPGTIDNIGGTISATADTLIGPISGVNGSGTLAVVDFTALAAGTSAIDIANVTLLDSNFNSITATIANGAATVTGGTVPEPSTLLLLGTGLLGVAGVLRRKLLS